MQPDTQPHIRYWFPTAVYDVNLGKEFAENNFTYHKKALEYRDAHKSVVSWKCDTYTTLNVVNLNHETEFESLISMCKFHVQCFAEHFGVTSRRIRCDDAWINIAATGNYQEYHVHSSSHFSLVYYVHAPDNCGDIIFRSPYGDQMFPPPIETPTEVSYITTSYTPKNARLLIFPSHLRHMVCKNESQEDRVSISMNFVFD